MHVDMDAFFAAIEMRNMPALKNRPVIVGGDPRFRSVVSTCNYEARRYGIKSGMPAAEAKRLCPQAVFISGTLGNYVYTSAQLIKIFENYTPIVQPLSVDEAVLDITGCHGLFGAVESLVAAMKGEIKEKLKLTCSVGISPNKYLAKLASGENKPDGMTVMDEADFQKRFYCRPVESLWGVGEATKKALNKIGIFNVEDLARLEEKKLRGHFGEWGTFLAKISGGKGGTEVHRLDNLPDEKSMSHETTLNEDLSDIDRIYAVVLWLSDKVAKRLRKGGFKAKTITIRVRSANFETITRDKTLAVATDQVKVIYNTARKLIPRQYGSRIKVRLLGVKASHLVRENSSEQMELIPDISGIKRELTGLVMDSLREKYGDSVIKWAGTKLY